MSRGARYLQIAEDIRNQIESSVLMPGQPLPTVRELAREYGVTTQTVAKATRHLADAGFIETKHGAGSRVTGEGRLVHPFSRRSNTIVALVHAELLMSETSHGALANQWFDASLNAITRVAGSLEMKTQVLGFGVQSREPSRHIVEAIDRAMGVLVLGDPPRTFHAMLKAAKVPVCFFNRPVPNELADHAVSVRAGAQRFGELVDYVLSLGHRTILYVWDTDPDYGNAEVIFRRSILRSRMLEWRCDPERDQIDLDISSHSRSNDIAGAVLDYVRSGCTAAVCYNDESAIRMYRILHYVGVQIPEEMSVVGFDGIPSGELLFPPLSTVSIDMVRVAQEAIRSLQLIAENLPYHPDILIPGELTIRRSATVPDSRPRK